jgi:phosphosulfolactate phosphohydrolase-like enzyme
MLRGWMEGYHARLLADRGFGEDVAFSATTDVLEHVPTLVAADAIESVSCPVVLVS